MISWAITVCNEHKELKRLLSQLEQVPVTDEIVVVTDEHNTTDEVLNVLDEFPTVDVYSHSLNGDFSTHKNFLKSKCTCDYIFQVDADEYLNDFLLEHIHLILKENDAIDAFVVPRINTVSNITKSDIYEWGWKLNENNWINFPDYQWRIFKNDPRIKWVNKVHEIVVGYTLYAALPAEPEYCLYHPKDINRQRAQNEFYRTLE